MYLFAAHRAYLAVFDEVGEASLVCKARRAYDESVAIADQPDEQRASFVAKLEDLTSRERKAGVRCGNFLRNRSPGERGRVAKKPASAATSKSPDEPSTLDVAASRSPGEPSPDAAANTTGEAAMVVTKASSEPAPVHAVAAEQATPGTLNSKPSAGPSEGDLLAVTRRPASETTSVPRPGRGLVIGGSVTLGLGLVLAGVASYTGSRLVETRRAAEVLHASFDGYATEEQLAEDAALRHDYRRLGPPTLALALVGGTSVVVGAVLLGVGARRMARTASRTAIVPVPGGVAFRARF
ncbi:hypothetical protein [Nannocystis exedens]|nr:hypothetical protein [Nannocystis exedens]